MSLQTLVGSKAESESLISGLERPRPRFSFSSNKSENSFSSHSTIGNPHARTVCERFRGCLPDISVRQWQLLAIFAVADFLAGVVYNIKGVLYPFEAEKKGVTPTQYGFVFGIFDMTKIFVCPLFGRYMYVLGPKRVFIFSMMLISVCSVCFGLLDKLDNSSVFLALSLIIRIFEAVGSAGFSTSSFSIIQSEFADTVLATTFASLETFFGMGLIAGPLLGGLFFQIGGYDAPFIVTGLLLFAAAVVIMVAMPDPHIIVQDQSSKTAEGYHIFSVLKIPGVLLAAFGVFTAAASTGFVNSTLEPHIRQFNLGPVEVGIVFVIYGTVYAITAPMFGWICDHCSSPILITLIGGGFNFCAFLLIGPAPFLPFNAILWVACIGLILHGLALGATFVSGFVLSLRYSIANGFPNNMATYGVVSGMWTSILSLGMFVGPSVGGILLEHVGFAWGSVFVLGSMIILILFIIIFLMKNGIHIKMKEPLLETEPLLTSQANVADDSTERRSPSYGSA